MYVIKPPDVHVSKAYFAAANNNENLYSPSKRGRQQTISNTNEIKQL